MATAYKCDKCESYFDKKIYEFGYLDTFRKNHSNHDIKVTIYANQQGSGDDFEFCGECWLKLLDRVKAELSKTLPLTSSL
jgi:hypothetical protein